MLTVLDEYTRESRCIHVDRKINAEKVQRVMARLIEEYGVPESVATMVLSLSKRTCVSGNPVRESKLCISNQVVLGRTDTSRDFMPVSSLVYPRVLTAFIQTSVSSFTDILTLFEPFSIRGTL